MIRRIANTARDALLRLDGGESVATTKSGKPSGAGMIAAREARQRKIITDQQRLIAAQREQIAALRRLLRDAIHGRREDA